MKFMEQLKKVFPPGHFGIFVNRIGQQWGPQECDN